MSQSPEAPGAVPAAQGETATHLRGAGGEGGLEAAGVGHEDREPHASVAAEQRVPAGGREHGGRVGHLRHCLGRDERPGLQVPQPRAGQPPEQLHLHGRVGSRQSGQRSSPRGGHTAAERPGTGPPPERTAGRPGERTLTAVAMRGPASFWRPSRAPTSTTRTARPASPAASPAGIPASGPRRRPSLLAARRARAGRGPRGPGRRRAPPPPLARVLRVLGCCGGGREGFGFGRAALGPTKDGGPGGT